MLSINTNLSSLIAQQSMSSATNKLNQAIERMTTGYKINGAKDNAANYSISQNMQTQLGSYDVAADNVAMGMDLVTTASDIINNMQDKASRLQALCTQARNGTYGAQSMSAINSEAGAIMAEIMRLYSTAEYNNVSLFNREAFQLTPEHQALTEELNRDVKAKAEYNGFIVDPKTYTDEEVAAMTRVKDASSFSSGQKYAIYEIEELEKLADYVNNGNSTTGVEFVLGADIDLSSISNWTPIGYNNADWAPFMGTFDGNGHLIKNLTIDSTESTQGLFGSVFYCEIKNVGVMNCNIRGKNDVGGLFGSVEEGHITNCYATGKVQGDTRVGGLTGSCEPLSRIENCYATCDVNGNRYIGGLAGWGCYLTNCYSTGNVQGDTDVGGLAGLAYCFTNSYSTGMVSGINNVGGLGGFVEGDFINCYATGDVFGTNNVGGLFGDNYWFVMTNCYATGDVQGDTNVGGILGACRIYQEDSYIIENCSSYSQTISGNIAVGSMVGRLAGEEINGYYIPGTLTIKNYSALPSLEGIGSYYKYDEDSDDYILDSTYDLSSYNSAVRHILLQDTSTSLQVGINSDESSRITFDTNFKFDLSFLENNIASDEALATIMEFTNLLSEKSTQLGAVQNRLDSALESITVNMENLTSSLSTIRDADIADVSSQYIQQQILQQASATLLATANQSPSIALQLI